MKKKKLKAALKREKYERECLALGIRHANCYADRLLLEVTALKSRIAELEQAQVWTPVGDSVIHCASDFRDTITTVHESPRIVVRVDSVNEEFPFNLGDLRICKKA